MVFDISVTITELDGPIKEKCRLAKKAGADRIELKQNDILAWEEKNNVLDEEFIDKFLPKNPPLPIIFTFYRPEEKPRLSPWTDKTWQELLHNLGDALHTRSIDYVDIESSLPKKTRAEAIEIARSYSTTLIISSHHYHCTPEERILRGDYKKAKSLGADIVKIVPRNNNNDDARRTLGFALKYCKKERVQIWGMGKEGRLTRLNPDLDSTFASFDGISAEGQMPLGDMYKIKRFYGNPRLREIIWDYLILEMYGVRA